MGLFVSMLLVLQLQKSLLPLLLNLGTGVITTSYECAKFHASTHSKNGADPIGTYSHRGSWIWRGVESDGHAENPGPDEYQCCPDGFGLGNIGKLLTPEDNLDEVKTNGWYRWERKAPPQGTLPSVIGQSMDATLIRVWSNGAVCYQESINITDEDWSWMPLRKNYLRLYHLPMGMGQPSHADWRGIPHHGAVLGKTGIL